MATEKFPVTPAVRALRAAKVEFDNHLYTYVEKGGTATSASALGVDEHCVIKTLVMEDENKKPLIILMHGDCEVSVRNLARQIGAKHIEPCQPNVAQKHTGYLVGGTSPLGTRHPMPVYIEESILSLPRIYLNGGKRGYLVSLKPQDLLPVLQPTMVNAATAN